MAVQMIMFVCVLQLVSSQLFDVRSIDSTSSVNRSAIGAFSRVGPRTHIDPSSVIGQFVKIGSDCRIGRGSSIDENCIIENGTVIGDNVHIKHDANIGERSEIGNNCEIGRNAYLANDVQIADGVRMGYNLNISQNVSIGKDCVLDENTEVKSNAVMEAKAYAGRYSKNGSNSRVGENAVVHKFANVPSNTTVNKNEIVIVAPTSNVFYRGCLSFDQISTSDVELVKNTADKPVSPEFNDHMRELLRNQMNQMMDDCQQKSPMLELNLSRIKSVYMMKFHGIDDYKRNMQTDSHAKRGLHIEYHFGSKAQKNILDSDVKERMINMLAMEHDLERKILSRVRGDTPCQICADIQTKRRNVKCNQ